GPMPSTLWETGTPEQEFLFEISLPNGKSKIKVLIPETESPEETERLLEEAKLLFAQIPRGAEDILGEFHLLKDRKHNSKDPKSAEFVSIQKTRRGSIIFYNLALDAEQSQPHQSGPLHSGQGYQDEIFWHEIGHGVAFDILKKTPEFLELWSRARL